MLRPPALILSALMLSGCLSSPSQTGPEGIEAYAGDPRLGEAARDICFAAGIDSFSMNEARTLVLRRGREEFMVEVYGSCPELAYAQNIGIDSSGGCLNRGDHLIISSSLHGAGHTGIGPDRCMVKDIYRWHRGRTADEPAPPAGEPPV